MWRLVRPDANSVWKSIAGDLLRRYREIFSREKLPFFQLAKKMTIEVDLQSTTDSLWTAHENFQKEFPNLIERADSGSLGSKDSSKPPVSYLDLKIELVRRILTNCHLCERRCGINRLEGEKGYCRITDIPKISSVHLHYGEEAPLVPSGTIFFMGCTFSCVFCQNYDISTAPEDGVEAPPEKLARYANHLIREENALNVNFVTPLANTHAIIASMALQTQDGAQLWNSNHYCTEETMKIIKDLMDFWLPDFKYGSDECAKKYSNTTNYVATLHRNLKMHYEWLERQNLSQNTIIRHLVMPNHVDCCTIPILDWIGDNIPNAMVNIMQQYHAAHKVNRSTFPEINRRVSEEEISRARRHATKLGLAWEPVS